MNQPQPEPYFEIPEGDSDDCIDIIMDGPGDPIVPPSESTRSAPRIRQIVDSYAIEYEKLGTVKKAVIRLSRSKADLIREGLKLVLEKHRDKLGDLVNQTLPGETPKADNGSRSA
jgi:hypothetical protein